MKEILNKLAKKRPILFLLFIVAALAHLIFFGKKHMAHPPLNLIEETVAVFNLDQLD
jgi:hypothetical protein